MTTAPKRIIRKKPERSKLEVVDIAVEDLIPDDDNPNEMDEATFDALIDEIRAQGFDEPIQVRPHPTMKGKYQIGSGHHRVKAATVIGMTHIPSVIKKWSDREQKVALTKRNVLRGQMNKGKLAKLYKELVKDHDPVQVQRELGFQDRKKFEAMIDEVSKNLNPKQKKKLAEAKEKIKSMDDLSSVLNRIFKESGSELDHGYMVFSFGGQDHHYYQIDKATNDRLKEIHAACDSADVPYAEFMQSIVSAAKLPAPKPSSAKKTVKKKPVSK